MVVAFFWLDFGVKRSSVVKFSRHNHAANHRSGGTNGLSVLSRWKVTAVKPRGFRHIRAADGCVRKLCASYLRYVANNGFRLVWLLRVERLTVETFRNIIDATKSEAASGSTPTASNRQEEVPFPWFQSMLHHPAQRFKRHPLSKNSRTSSTGWMTRPSCRPSLALPAEAPKDILFILCGVAS